MWANWRISIAGFLASALVVAQPARPDYGSINDEALIVSIISLIANGPAYDGKAVRVVGAFRIEFEGDALCLDGESLRHRVHANCISLGVDPRALGTTREALASLNERYVLVEGTFRVEEKGHISVNVAGGLDPVSRVFPREDPP